MNAQTPIVARNDASSEAQRHYRSVRQASLDLIQPLQPEDMVVQSMADTSPAKWHLAHTTWFFETFLLKVNPDYVPFSPNYGYLFNSYYEALGPRQSRGHRGLLTRPSLADVLAYRRHVDSHMETYLQSAGRQINELFQLGIAHEQQHQELLLMDIQHLFSQQPLLPVYNPDWPADKAGRSGTFRLRPGGPVEIGHVGSTFAFDNEGPRHRVWLQPFEINDRLVTNREWLAFMADNGYSRAELWLSDGWAQIQNEQWVAPMYWRQTETGWQAMGLSGLVPLDQDSPVTYVSYYEAEAFARWAGARLPTEAEWEMAAVDGVLEQLNDVAWQWTGSSYLPYPGFASSADAAGEYNGKFMSGQMVLRGGSSFTPNGHSRPTYRNFFKPEQRWMRSGLRLARDLDKATTNVTIGWDAAFADDVVAGLSGRQKTLSPKYFYDAVGSELFEAICRVPEYYPTRAETQLLAQIAPQLAKAIPSNAVLLEFGSGASDKTRLLLDAAPWISDYVPIDISEDALRQATIRLSHDYPNLVVTPVFGDFTTEIQLPAGLNGRPLVGFFPGSTIGNFTPLQAKILLRDMQAVLGNDALLIVGADIVKDKQTMVAAYDDAEGVTAAFNKNLLTRINRELGGNFDLDAFDHLAVWNPVQARMEMHLVSKVDQIVTAARHSFAFKMGERLHTENSHKFTLDLMQTLAAAADYSVEKHWISAAPEFGVFLLRGDR
jgi:dimethylhistidine N-methyltransferase